MEIGMNKSGSLELTLEEKCKVCGKTGKTEYGQVCYGCDGKGYILTEAGAEVLEMVKRHLKLDGIRKDE